MYLFANDPCLHDVESAGGSARGSREDLYSSRGYHGSNSSLNDGTVPLLTLPSPPPSQL